jgi:catechol 2,3-dioxygenase-like lactoylglutathione lyase family enzyme
MGMQAWRGWMALLALGAGSLIAPAQAPAPQSPDLTGLAHVALRVSDLDAEVNFFGKMGFEEAFTNVHDGHTLQVFIKVNDMQFIEVYPRTEANQPMGFLHACFESADLNKLRARYDAAGLRPTEVHTAAAGNLLFSLIGLDGRPIEFTQYMPDSRQMQDKGQHLGESRVADELLGFELPVKNLVAARRLYEKLGFDAQPEGAGVRLSIPANPDVRIELHPEKAGDQPQFLVPVDSAKRAAEQLHRAGLKVVRDKKLVFLRDPDGNAFVLLETGQREHHPRHLIPWRK